MLSARIVTFGDKVFHGVYTERSECVQNYKLYRTLVILQKGDSFYIFSDGFADQFNSNDKKLMTKKFKEILLTIQDKTMEKQKEFLNSFIKNWKGNTEQTDDILVIGIRV